MQQETQQENGFNNNKKPASDLYLRLLSAIVLIVIALGATYAGVIPFAIMVAIGVILMCLEWSRLTDPQGSITVLSVQVATCLGSCLVFMLNYHVIALILMGIGAVLSFLLCILRPRSDDLLQPGRPMWVALGVFYVALPALALIWFRKDADYGVWAVLYLFLVVWVADSAAYFAGRGLGGPKLWPRVSPKKTWSGFAGALLGSVLVGLVFSFFLEGEKTTFLLLQSLILGMFAQIGDLAESGLKRHFNIKDSGALIPGHGGILDRVDGLVFAACTASVIALYFNMLAPGKTLLTGL